MVNETKKLFETHRIAINMNEVWGCLENLLKRKIKVYVREIHTGKLHPLLDVMDSPFKIMEDIQEIMAFDKKNKNISLFRINSENNWLMEIKRISDLIWLKPFWGDIQIYIPK